MNLVFFRMANGAVRGLKIALYLVVIGSTATMLYGFVKATASVDRCLFGGGNCVLFGHMTKHNSTHTTVAGQNCSSSVLTSLVGFNVPKGYSEDLCRFCLAAMAMQLAVSVLGSLVVYYRWSSGKPGRTGCSVAELIVVVLMCIASLLSSSLIFFGLRVFCQRLLAGWEGSFMEKHLGIPMPTHCSRAPLFTKDNVDFYSGMHLAQTCSFVALAAWAVHLLISSISVHSYRKNGPTPLEEVQSEKDRRRSAKEKKALKKKEKDLKKKTKAAKKSKSGRRDKHMSAWDEGAEMV